MADRRPLISESSDPSDTGNNTPALPSLGFSSQSPALGFGAHDVSPPSSPPQSPPQSSRPGYSRIRSDATVVTPATVHEVDEEEDIADSFGRRTERGLGIASPATPTSNRRVSIQTIPRIVSIGASRSPLGSPDPLSTPQTGDPLNGGFPQDSAGSTPDLRRERFSPRDNGRGFNEIPRGVLRNGHRSQASLDTLDDYQQYLHSSDRERLRPGAPSVRTSRSAYETDFRPTQECPTTKDFYISRFSWISVCIVIICLFSTVFSAIFLALALQRRRYGRAITSKGSFKPSDAILLTSITAKPIELSFVTSFVAFLGQVLSRRAFMREQGRGVTLSELSMWRWVVQPGTLITHWETAKYAGVSVLGILSLLSALLATLYTPAATAVVQPVLTSSAWDHKVMAGRVQTDFANVDYVRTICETPITDDPKEGANTCLQIEHAGQGYHNYQRYLASWKEAGVDYNNGTTDQQRRPQGFGLLHENTTITGQWINIINTTAVSKEHKRAINNVSLAMPHSGVFQAARDQRNDILQPEELNSEGVYSIRASVPSPVLNVLCANMNESELAPIVYDTWNDYEYVNGTTWYQLKNNATTTNETVVDELFGWAKTDPFLDYPPVFAKYPKPYNTILNHTKGGWGRDSIYLLGQGGAVKDAATNNLIGSNLTGIYVLCKLHVSLTPECSTHYNATGSGGTMSAHCEDPEDDMAYIKSYTNATKAKSVPSWFDIAFDWSSSLSLNTGIDDGAASNARLLTQLILQPTNTDPEYLQVDLSDKLPSVGEALAVMSGCTLLKSMQDAPFVEFWNHTKPSFTQPDTQYFNASIMAQQYASGGQDHVSRAWIVVLLLVFLMNVFVLVYFLFHRGLVTDFSEPPNLFALTINSPPSHLLKGSCGGGPEGKQYMVNWFVNTEGDHLYMEPGANPVHDGKDHNHAHAHAHTHVQRAAPDSGSWFSPITNQFNKLRERGLHIGSRKTQTRLRPVSVMDGDVGGEFELVEDGSTRTRRQYDMLSKRRSML